MNKRLIYFALIGLLSGCTVTQTTKQQSLSKEQLLKIKDGLMEACQVGFFSRPAAAKFVTREDAFRAAERACLAHVGLVYAGIALDDISRKLGEIYE